MKTYTINGSNEFHDGWIAGMLGLERTACPPDVDRGAWIAGYVTARETYSVVVVSSTIQAMRRLGQLTIE